MRDLRFRAWDKERKWMYECNAIMLPYKPMESDSCVIMQYTGLKDKNGKDIYEGDIVVKPEYIWFDEGKPNYHGTVEWVYSQWQVIAHCVNPEKAGISDGINYGLNDDGVEEGDKSEWEVIGNIWEKLNE